jgi:hypothetical protein
MPVFRVASSGISLLANADGEIESSAPYAKDYAIIKGTMKLPPSARMPLDRWIVLLCVVAMACVAGMLFADYVRQIRVKPAVK